MVGHRYTQTIVTIQLVSCLDGDILVQLLHPWPFIWAFLLLHHTVEYCLIFAWQSSFLLLFGKSSFWKLLDKWVPSTLRWPVLENWIPWRIPGKLKKQILEKDIILATQTKFIGWTYIFDRPGVAGAVLKTASSLIHWLIN